MRNAIEWNHLKELSYSLTDNQLTMQTQQQPRLLSFWRSHTVIIETW